MRILFAVLLSFLSCAAFAQTLDIKVINTPWRGDAALGEAEKLLAEKKYADVLTATDRMTIRNIRNTDAHVLAAIAWYNLGNFEKAKQALTNALAIDKGHMGAYLVAGLVALRENDKGQADYYLNALHVVCQNDLCPEFKLLQTAVREYVEKD